MTLARGGCLDPVCIFASGTPRQVVLLCMLAVGSAAQAAAMYLLVACRSIYPSRCLAWLQQLQQRLYVISFKLGCACSMLCVCTLEHCDGHACGPHAELLIWHAGSQQWLALLRLLCTTVSKGRAVRHQDCCGMYEFCMWSFVKPAGLLPEQTCCWCRTLPNITQGTHPRHRLPAVKCPSHLGLYAGRWELQGH